MHCQQHVPTAQNVPPGFEAALTPREAIPRTEGDKWGWRYSKCGSTGHAMSTFQCQYHEVMQALRRGAISPRGAPPGL